MEIYILDDLLREIDLIDGDNYESFVWAERYAAKGDFKIVALASPSMRNRLVKDTMLTIRGSKRVMRVNKTTETIDEEKGATITVEGYEIVSVLEQRVASVREEDENLRAVTYWNGWTPIELITDLVWRACVLESTWILNPGDAIPFLNNQATNPVSLYPTSNIPEPEPGGIVWEQKLASVYSAVTDVAKAYGLGFRMYKDPNSSTLYFEGYNGVDRTTRQSIYPPVVFSSDMQNLINTTEYIDNTAHFNVVMVVYIYKNPAENPYPEELTITETVSDPELAFSSGGFDQKTKTITVSQLPADEMTEVQIRAYLQQLGKEELTRSRPSDIYDGEVDPNASFQYERDYNLGDIVEVRGDNGGVAFMRVEEQIFKYDAQGKASYPSLITKKSVSPGTWKSWKYDVSWSSMDNDEYWNTQ